MSTRLLPDLGSSLSKDGLRILMHPQEPRSVWLVQGLGLCHGIAGNTAALLFAVHNLEHLDLNGVEQCSRLLCFGCVTYEQLKNVPDRPSSLYEVSEHLEADNGRSLLTLVKLPRSGFIANYLEDANLPAKESFSTEPAYNCFPLVAGHYVGRFGLRFRVYEAPCNIYTKNPGQI